MINHGTAFPDPYIVTYIPAPPLTDPISIQKVLPRVLFGGRILGQKS
jgi:hypothetical protein